MGLDQWFKVYTKEDSEDSEVRIHYWKLNWLRKWITENTELTYEDNCKEVTVDIEKLKKLKNNCDIVLEDNSKAEDILPTQGGFFFGSSDYNDRYFKSVLEVRDNIEEILNMKDVKKICYSDWW